MAEATVNEMGQATCFHCFEPVPRGLELTVRIDGAAQPMCCYGCQSVAQTIVDQGLTHFYKYRDTSTATPALIPDELQQIQAQLKQYDDPDIQREFVKSTEHTQMATLAIEGMTCAACAWLIEKQLYHIQGVLKVVVNSTTERVQVEWDQRHTQLSQILSAIYAVGYKALPFQQADLEASYERKRKGYIRRLGVAGIASMQTMMVAFGLYYEDIDETTKLYFWWVSLLFTAPVIVYSCQPFFANAIRALKARTLNMDVPVALAMAIMFIASFYATVTDTGEVYYECVTMFAFFLLSGRFLELQARHKALANAANLMKLIPAIAEREAPDGSWSQVMVKYLETGDRIRVRPGDTIPVDGTLETAQAWCDEAMLTGESRPVAKQQGDTVYAGAINQEQAITIQVAATRQDTLLSGIIALQDSAMEQKPKFVRIADVVGRYFIGAMLIVSLLTYTGWLFVDPDRAFWVTLAVLVATCPCALSLAAPTAMSGAVSRLNRTGILLKQAVLVERVPHMKTLCVDKTGTLTKGKFALIQQWYLRSELDETWVMQMAAALEASSEHPLARPFIQAAAPLSGVTTENVPGSGIEGVHGASRYRLGNQSFVEGLAGPLTAPSPSANVFLGDAHGLIAAWQVDDEVREGARDAIQWAQYSGMNVVMLTGDSHARAHALAQELGIDRVFAELKPDDKLHHLEQLRTEGPVLMIGDGINDGPVLAAADGSITFASGSDLAQSSSDVVFLTGDFSALKRLQQTSLKTKAIIRQNFAWALGYNLTILPLAITGFVGPLLAMLGMSISSLIVVSNSLRLMKRAK